MEKRKELKLEASRKGRKDMRIKEIIWKRKKNVAGKPYKYDTLSFL
jgi:hypothetical protein